MLRIEKSKNMADGLQRVFGCKTSLSINLSVRQPIQHAVGYIATSSSSRNCVCCKMMKTTEQKIENLCEGRHREIFWAGKF